MVWVELMVVQKTDVVEKKTRNACCYIEDTFPHHVIPFLNN